ncbi:aminopeptidase NAALADL1 isoform X2 [Lasioglossum baleicum]|uniref:aminopeptidase NAALADL1 isoform X2 n=1 Tax=Lasioglossum baleicum TaxID=434251 RepID=UPI003FCD8B18
MQRVLSFQMARGLNESSEFVTKRMCFSFLFSVGFLCLLCGFLLGRFSMQRALEFRAEKKRLELAGNGLDSNEYLQRFMLELLETAPLDADFEVTWKSFGLWQANGILSNLSLVDRVIEHQSYIVASVRGSREPDRYVVLSASDQGVGIALKLAKSFNDVQRQHGWKPRRSIIFCLFFGPVDPCPETIFSFTKHRVLAYIVIHHQGLQGRGPLIVSGTDVVQSVVLEAGEFVRDSYSYNNQFVTVDSMHYNSTISRLAVDVPHAVLSFVNSDLTVNDSDRNESRKVMLAQILSRAIWRLSECLIVKWNPSYFNETVYRALESINSTEFVEVKEKIQETSVTLLNNIDTLNGRIDTVDSTKYVTLKSFIQLLQLFKNINAAEAPRICSLFLCSSTLDTRILNDLMMDFERALLCPDVKSRSKTSWAEFLSLNHNSFNISLIYLKEMVKCYEAAIQLLQNR